MRKYYEEHKMKPTRDNWCPNFPNNQVSVSIYLNMGATDDKDDEGIGIWHRVCVWGSDDCGMEIDFTEHQEEDALNVYAKVMNLDFVDFAHVKSLGFKGA